MRKFFTLTWFHSKRLLRNLEFIIIIFLAPLLIAGFWIFIYSSDTFSSTLNFSDNLAVVNHSNFFQEYIYPNLSEELQESFVGEASAIRALEGAEISVVYEIPRDFPRENLIAYSISGESENPVFTGQLLQESYDILRNHAYQEASIPPMENNPIDIQIIDEEENIGIELSMILVMFSIFILYGSGVIGKDLARFNQNQLLKRSLISKTKNWQVLGSILTGGGLLMWGSVFLSILLFNFIFSIPVPYILPVLLLSLSVVIFSLGTAMTLFRVLKEAETINITVILFPLVLMPLASLSSYSPILESINHLNPVYWIFRFIDTGEWKLGFTVLNLLGLLLFTGGNIRIEKFITK